MASDPSNRDFIEEMLFELRWWMWPLALAFWVVVFVYFDNRHATPPASETAICRHRIIE